MDYDSEEGSEGDEGEDLEEEPEEESRDAPADSPPTEEPDQLAETEIQDQMRVNAVLAIGKAVENYKYDSLNGLWCEVGADCLGCSSLFIYFFT